MSAAVRNYLYRVTPRSASYHTSVALRAYKNSQDRNSLRPGSTEYTKSGRDDEAASEHPDAAFNPDKTSPEEALRTSKQESVDSDALEASGANQDLKKAAGDEKTARRTGAGKEISKGGTSREKSSEKRGTLNKD